MSEIYRIYGTVKDQFVGFIRPENITVSNEEEALKASNQGLIHRGITPTKAVKVKDTELEIKNLDVRVSFLYSGSCYFKLENCAGMPSIVIHDQTQENEFTAIGFGDLQVAEELLEKVNRCVEYLREKGIE